MLPPLKVVWVKVILCGYSSSAARKSNKYNLTDWSRSNQDHRQAGGKLKIKALWEKK